MSDLREVYGGQADGRFERILCQAVRGGLRLTRLGPDHAVGLLGDRGLLLVRWSPDVVPWLEERIRELSTVGIDAVLVGGPVGDLRDALPTFSGSKVSAWHVGEDARVAHVTGPDGPTGALLTADDPPDWVAFWETVEGMERAANAQQRALQEGLRGRRPVATVALLTVFGLVFLAESWFGAPDWPVAMTRMGSLVRDRVLAGELWRMASCTVLHGSLFHLLANSYVTWSLGSSLERLLGSARFCLIYAGSAFAGSLASLLFIHGNSVGASGAIWGLMTAQAVLGWRGGGILPAHVLAAIRKGFGTNLLMNVGISMMPGVDWAAHAGGGVAGALLALAGVVTVGMPRWAALAEGEAPPPDRVPALVRAGAVVGMTLLAIGAGIGLSVGKVWTLADPPRFAEALAMGWTLEVPEGLPAQPNDGSEQVFGNLLEDPAVVAMVGTRFDAPIAPEEQRATIDDLAGELADLGDGFVAVTPIRLVEREGVPLLEGTWQQGDVSVVRAAKVTADGVVRVDVVRWKDAPGAWESVAAHMVATAR